MALAAGGQHSLGIKACAGDLNGDGDSDLADFTVLFAHLGTTGVTYTDGDLDGDGDVDLYDFAVLSNVFGGSCF